MDGVRAVGGGPGRTLDAGIGVAVDGVGGLLATGSMLSPRPEKSRASSCIGGSGGGVPSQSSSRGVLIGLDTVLASEPTLLRTETERSRVEYRDCWRTSRATSSSSNTLSKTSSTCAGALCVCELLEYAGAGLALTALVGVLPAEADEDALRNGIAMLGFLRHEDLEGDFGGGPAGGREAAVERGLRGGGDDRSAGGSWTEGVGGVRIVVVLVDEEEYTLSFSFSNAEPEVPETLELERDRPTELANGWFFGSVGDLGARGSGAADESSASCRGSTGGRGVVAGIIARSERRAAVVVVVVGSSGVLLGRVGCGSF